MSCENYQDFAEKEVTEDLTTAQFANWESHCDHCPHCALKRKEEKNFIQRLSHLPGPWGQGETLRLQTRISGELNQGVLDKADNSKVIYMLPMAACLLAAITGLFAWYANGPAVKELWQDAGVASAEGSSSFTPLVNQDRIFGVKSVEVEGLKKNRPTARDLKTGALLWEGKESIGEWISASHPSVFALSTSRRSLMAFNSATGTSLWTLGLTKAPLAKSVFGNSNGLWWIDGDSIHHVSNEGKRIWEKPFSVNVLVWAGMNDEKESKGDWLVAFDGNSLIALSSSTGEEFGRQNINDGKNLSEMNIHQQAWYSHLFKTKQAILTSQSHQVVLASNTVKGVNAWSIQTWTMEFEKIGPDLNSSTPKVHFKQMWKSQAENVTDLLMYQDRLFVRDKAIIAMNLENGAELWRRDAIGCSPLSVHDGRLLLTDTRKNYGLIALDPVNGELLFSQADLASCYAISSSKQFGIVVSQDGILHVLKWRSAWLS